MSSIALDFRLAWRWLARRPGLAAIGTLSLALGIGANAAVFSLVDALLFRPFPVSRSEELLSIGSGREGDPSGVSAPDARDLRDRQAVLTGLAAHAPFTFAVRAGSATERLEGELVSWSYFDVLGISPRPGRGFHRAEEEVPSPVAVISHRLWRARFAADRGVLGRRLRVNGRDLEIVGVAPEGFRGLGLAQPSDLWIPLSMLSDLWPGVVEFYERRDTPFLNLVGRAKPGLSFRQVDAAMKAYASALAQSYPETNRGVSAQVVPLDEVRLADRGSVVSYLGIVLGIVAAVFAIACTNVAGLRLLDLFAREGDVAIRRALGASRARLARQFLLENVLLYALAFGCSLLVAFGSIRLLERLTLFRMAIADLQLGLDVRVLVATGALSFLGAALGGLALVLASRRFALPGRSRRLAGAGGRIRSGWVTGQVALSVALLAGAGLLGRTLQKVYAIDPGFRTDSVLFLTVDLQSMEFRYDEARAREFYREVLERVRALPGVREAAWSADTPFERFTILTRFVPEEAALKEEPDWIESDADIVTPGYLRTMGIELVRGRDFLDSDGPDSPGVVLVNETMARTRWPGVDPLGKRIRVWTRRGIRHELYEVVGVVRDVKVRTLWEEPRPYLYFPLAQRFFQRMNLHVHTAGPPASMLPAVREAVRAVDDDLPVYDARPIGEERALLLIRQRSIFSLLAASALLSLVLTAVGAYGLTAHRVQSRLPEVGLRMALGAEGRDIAGWVLRHGMIPVIAGTFLGVLLSLGVGKALGSLLIGVAPTDAVSLAGAALLLAASAALACLIPARRASSIDPAEALRGE